MSYTDAVDPITLTTMLAGVSLPVAVKVVHSVLDSLNRRRAPSRDILVQVDGPAEVDTVIDLASRLVQQIEQDEGLALADMPADVVKRNAELLVAATEDRTQSDLPAADEDRARALLDDLRLGSSGAS